MDYLYIVKNVIYLRQTDTIEKIITKNFQIRLYHALKGND